MMSQQSVQCNVCSCACKQLSDLGNQPYSNRFLNDPQAKIESYHLRPYECLSCGLVQIEPPSIAELKAQFDWISYNEPEKHLDSLVEILESLPAVNRSDDILAVSYKERTTLERLMKRGFSRCRTLSLDNDLQIKEPLAGIESIQDAISNRDLSKISSAKIVLARHILEHSFGLQSFCEGLKTICQPEGYIVFEVPDCSKIFKNSDYCFLWEEHIVYFTEETFRQSLDLLGFDVVYFRRYEYAIEDSLVAVTKPSKKSRTETRFFHNYFVETVEEVRAHYKMALTERKKKGKIALFGIGHNAIKFVNFYGLGKYIDYFIDDTPQKMGLFIPGASSSIVGSEVLSADSQIKLCLLAVSPENEAKISERLQGFVSRGGTLASAFRSSDMRLF